VAVADESATHKKEYQKWKYLLTSSLHAAESLPAWSPADNVSSLFYLTQKHFPRYYLTGGFFLSCLFSGVQFDHWGFLFSVLFMECGSQREACFGES
jgi:hypothetical protein